MTQPRAWLASRRGRLVAMAAVLCVAAACSGSYDRLATGTTTTTTSTTRPNGSVSTTTAAPTTTRPTAVVPTTTAPNGATTTTIAGSVNGLPGRIAVIAFDGSLFTMRPDMSDQKVLAAGGPGISVASPAWMPDATRMVWTALGTNSIRVRSATVDNTDARDAVLSPPATTYVWNPSGTALAAIRAMSTTTAELDAVDPVTLSTTSLASGAAVYAAWSPDGKRLAAHVDDRLLVITPGGATQTLALSAAAFGAPQWFDDNSVVVAVRDGAKQTVAIVDIATGTRRDLLNYTGQIRLQIEPKHTRLAFQSEADPTGGGASKISFRQTATTSTATTPPTTTAPMVTVEQDQLGVIDLATRAITIVSTTAVEAFSWSPTSARLAYLSIDSAETARWHFWSPQVTIDGAGYAPPRVFLQQYVRQFDQTNLSQQWWSPDGQAFVYAGRAGPRTGVFIQQMTVGMAAVYAGEGDIAIWSPK